MEATGSNDDVSNWNVDQLDNVTNYTNGSEADTDGPNNLQILLSVWLFALRYELTPLSKELHGGVHELLNWGTVVLFCLL